MNIVWGGGNLPRNKWIIHSAGLEYVRKMGYFQVFGDKCCSGKSFDKMCGSNQNKKMKKKTEYRLEFKNSI